MSDVDDLVARSQKQLDEHKLWLAAEIEKIPHSPEFTWQTKYHLVNRALEISLRVAKVSGVTASVVYDYPDDLFEFLRSGAAPAHLRSTLEGSHVVSPNQPTFSAEREDG